MKNSIRILKSELTDCGYSLSGPVAEHDWENGPRLIECDSCDLMCNTITDGRCPICQFKAEMVEVISECGGDD